LIASHGSKLTGPPFNVVQNTASAAGQTDANRRRYKTNGSVVKERFIRCRQYRCDVMGLAPIHGRWWLGNQCKGRSTGSFI